MRIGGPRLPKAPRTKTVKARSKTRTGAGLPPPIAPQLPKHHQPTHRVVVDEGMFDRPTPPIVPES